MHKSITCYKLSNKLNAPNLDWITPSQSKSNVSTKNITCVIQKYKKAGDNYPWPPTLTFSKLGQIPIETSVGGVMLHT